MNQEIKKVQNRIKRQKKVQKIEIQNKQIWKKFRENGEKKKKIQMQKKIHKRSSD